MAQDNPYETSEAPIVHNEILDVDKEKLRLSRNAWRIPLWGFLISLVFLFIPYIEYLSFFIFPLSIFGCLIFTIIAFVNSSNNRPCFKHGLIGSAILIFLLMIVLLVMVAFSGTSEEEKESIERSIDMQMEEEL